MGDLNGARPHALALRDLVERRSTQRQDASQAIWPMVFISCLEGDWKAGRLYNDRGLELSLSNPFHLYFRALLEHETGEFAQGEVYLERLLENKPQNWGLSMAPIAITAIARITDVPDRLEMAGAAAEAALSARPWAPFSIVLITVGLALLAVQNGDQSAAKEHYSYLLGQRSTMTWAISVDRLLGLLSQAMGNVDQATIHFEDALTLCRKAGCRPELAWTCCDYADTLRERGNDGDKEQAVALFDESLTISSDLGMRPLMERVLSRREILKA